MTLKVDDEGWVEFETGAATFALHQVREGKVPTGHNMPVPVFSVDNFTETYEGLKAAGIKFEKEPTQVCEAGPGKVGMSVEFKDPDGNMLSVFGFLSK